MAKNDSKAQKAARNLEYANKFRKKKAPVRFNRGPNIPRPASPATPGSAPMGQRQMYPAICSACGVETQVPFQPTEGRQVLCRSCFKPAEH